MWRGTGYSFWVFFLNFYLLHRSLLWEKITPYQISDSEAELRKIKYDWGKKIQNHKTCRKQLKGNFLLLCIL